MSEHFDPYHKWLGIPLKDQPPNHYRLLGVDRFETDREVIDAAANRLMAYLQDLSTGEQADAAQRLLNQIAAARLVLLTPDKKAAYDQRLRADSAPMARPISPQSPPAAAPAPPAPVPAPNVVAPAAPAASGGPAPGATGGPIVVADEPHGRRNASSSPRGAVRTSRKQPSLVPIIILAIAALVIAGIATFILMQPGTLTSDPNASSGPTTRLRIVIDEKDRSGVLVSIGGMKRDVPATGEISYPGKPGPTTLIIRRRGYETITQDLMLMKNVITEFRPTFQVDKDGKSDPQFDIPGGALDDLSKAVPKPDEPAVDEPMVDESKIDEPDLDP